MQAYIYKITNLTNGKLYIGRTIQDPPAKRWYTHRNDARKGSDMLLHRAMRKYGVDNFSFEIIHSFYGSQLEIANTETEYIQMNKSLIPNGYNVQEKDKPKKIWLENDRKSASERMKKINATPERKFINKQAGQMNRGRSKNGLPIGVYKRGKSFASEICNNSDSINLGSYRTAKDAAIAYDNKARELWGGNAKVNFSKVYPQPKKIPTRQDSGSKVLGVGFSKKVNKWRARIANNKLKIDLHLGYYDSELLAAHQVFQFWLILSHILK